MTTEKSLDTLVREARERNANNAAESRQRMHITMCEFIGTDPNASSTAPVEPSELLINELVSDADIEKIMLEHGYKKKQQEDGTLALNPYVFAAARALIAHAYRRLDETVCLHY